MPYLTASTLPKVGYRHYGSTNPRGAANLSGLDAEATWKLGQVNFFDPWILHGMDLGQLHPFNEDPGGWVLHGDFLGQDEQPPEPVESPPGTRVVFHAVYEKDALDAIRLITPCKIVSNIESRLDRDYGLVVEHADCSDVPVLESPEFTLHVLDTGGHSLLAHVRGILRDAVEQERSLISGEIISVQKPGGRTDDHRDDSPQDPLQWLMHNAVWIGLGLGALVIVPRLIGKR